jgi:hypothetical protein
VVRHADPTSDVVNELLEQADRDRVRVVHEVVVRVHECDDRVLQRSADPDAALAELRRVTAQDAWIAVTDTDWGTFTVQHPHAQASARLAAAALRWVPHPRVAHDLPDALASLSVSEPQVRTDTVVITAWDPDDPAQSAGPPGLPLRSIIATAAPEDRSALAEDLEVLADLARGGAFHATLVLVTVVARG